MKLGILITTLCIGAIAAADPTITSVTARQRYPWNGLVDIVITIQNETYRMDRTVFSFAASNSTTHAAIKISAVSQIGKDIRAANSCTRHYLWNSTEDVPEVKIDDLVLTVVVKEEFGGVQLWADGPYWAECNVGATKPEEYGYYFWWGDTVGYVRNADNTGWVSVKDGSSFSFSRDNCPTSGKSNPSLHSDGYLDSIGNLVATHDAATAHLAAPWRMPTDEETRALINNCTTAWTKRNGIYGRIVTGKGDYASKSIFLPAASEGSDSYLIGTGSSGWYWSSTSGPDYSGYTCYLYFYSDRFSREEGGRYNGRSVRPLRGFASTEEALHLSLDNRTGARTAVVPEKICYSTDWVTADTGASAVVAVNGGILSSIAGSGVYEWTPPRDGTYTLTHTVLTNGVQVGETLTATFVADGFTPEMPVINPVSGTSFDSSLSISMTCASEGATIHYTTDGSTPTMGSSTYKRFRIYGKTAVKAIAFYEDGTASDMAVAEYALGQCPDPTITSDVGETFVHGSARVSIAWECEDGVLRYTTDGSDVTETSPEYTGALTIDDTTTVKAKAFGDTYFDSQQIVLTVTKNWESVAMPVIDTEESFTGGKTRVSMSCANEGATIYYTLDGSEPNTHSERYTGAFEVQSSTVIKAFATLSDYADSAVSTKSITKIWGIGDSVGLPDHSFTTNGAAGWLDENGQAMRSGKISDNQVSILQSSFVGKGHLSFELKTSCEEDDPEYIEYDHAEVWIDGIRQMRRDGIHDWETYEYDLDAGTHTVEWKYVKDEADETTYIGEDCIWIRNIIWQPELTCTTQVPVKLDWLRNKYGDLGNYYFSYEEKASGTALNGHKVWECYVAGEEPTDSNSLFQASVEMVDGMPIIHWSPDLNSNSLERIYTVWGKTNLTDKAWHSPTNECSHFFKVTVEMP